MRAVLPRHGTSAVFQARLQARIPPSRDTASRPRARKRSAASILVLPAAHTVTTRPPLVGWKSARTVGSRSEEHTSELQSRPHLVCRLLLEKKKKTHNKDHQGK